MPWRLILFIFVFALLVVFISFNLENKCDLSFGFKTFTDVPVYLTIFISFVVGFFCTLPFIIFAGIKRKNTGGSDSKNAAVNNAKKEKKQAKDTYAAKESGDVNPAQAIDAKAARERFLAGRRGGND